MRLMLAALALCLLCLPAFAAEKETAYERVMRTGTLRCGYFPYEPMLMRDPNTGAMSGIAADLTEAIGRRLNLKIEWSAEFGFATSVTDLQGGKFDVACMGFWRLPLEAKFFGYTMPFSYSFMQVYARADDKRFDNALEKINSKDITIVSADGHMSSSVARADFPLAKLNELPNMSSLTQQFEDILAGKADVLLTDSSAAAAYMKANPGKIKVVPAARPLHVFQNTFAMDIHETALKSMMDSALIDIVGNGEMEKILKKYDPDGVMYLPVVKGYKQ